MYSSTTLFLLICTFSLIYIDGTHTHTYTNTHTYRYGNNNEPSPVFEFEVDRKRPTMTIYSPDMRGDLSDDPHLTTRQTFRILFVTDDHTIRDFNLSDVNCSSSTMFDVVNLSRIDSHTFEAYVVQNIMALNSVHYIHIDESAFQDEVAHLSERSNVFSWRYLPPDPIYMSLQGVLHSVEATWSFEFEFDREIISDTANVTVRHSDVTTRIPLSLMHGRKAVMMWASEVLGPYVVCSLSRSFM